jgi:hypothetical protein
MLFVKTFAYYGGIMYWIGASALNIVSNFSTGIRGFIIMSTFAMFINAKKVYSYIVNVLLCIREFMPA